IRYTCVGGCAWAASGAVSRLRVSVIRHPTALYHIVLSSRRPHADLLLSMDAEQRLNRTFCLETEVERAKVPHTMQPAAYHSIVQLYVCGCWRCRGADPSGSDNTLGCYRECSGESPRGGLTPGPEHFG